MRLRVLAHPDSSSTLRPVMGPRGLPMSAARQLRSDPARLATSLRARVGDISFVSALGRDIVIAQGPDAAAELLRDADRAYANGPVYGFALGSVFERGILLMDAPDHRRHRRLMQQAFTAARLDGYQQRLNDLIRSRVAGFGTGSGVDMRAELKALALDVAFDIFVGERLPQPEADRLNRAFVELIEAGGALVRLPIPGTAHFRGRHARRVVDEMFAELIPRRRREPGTDLMSALCQACEADGRQLSDAQIVDHMRFMLFAAHDTATIAMTSMTYQLGRHPQWRERVRAQAFSLSDAPSAAELRESAAMDSVFKEAVRLRPPVPVIPRAAVKDTELGGHFIPKGTFVVVVTGSNHRLPEIWPDPDSFLPDRFDGDTTRHRMAWMPFGGGAHMCIGMHFAYLESATVVHHMLRHLDWTVASDAYEREDTALTDNIGFAAEVSRLSPA